MAFLGGLLGNGLQAQAPASAQPQGMLGGLGQALSQLQQQNPEFLQAIGTGLMSGDLPGAVEQGNKLQALRKAQEQNDAMQREGWDRDDQRFAQTFGLQKENFGLEKARFASEAQDKRALQNATADFLEKNGADPSLVGMARAGQGAAAFKMFQEIKGGGLTNSGREVSERQQYAQQFGLTPGTPDFQRYVLTGNLPNNDKGVTAGDRQAIREADDGVQAAVNADMSLAHAQELSGQAMDGAGAGARAAIGNNLPDWMVPDGFASPEASRSTSELDNTVTAGALDQMKSIFGGNPTEGERAILLDIQGSSKRPKAVRDAIYKRAREAVARRLQYNKDRAGELRGGTYYDAKPLTADAPAPPPASLKDKYGLE